MNRITRIILLCALLAMLLLSGLITPAPIHAQGDPYFDWDLTASDGGFTGSNHCNSSPGTPSWTSGNGWTATAGPTTGMALDLEHSLPGYGVSQVEITYSDDMQSEGFLYVSFHYAGGWDGNGPAYGYYGAAHPESGTHVVSTITVNSTNPLTALWLCFYSNTGGTDTRWLERVRVWLTAIDVTPPPDPPASGAPGGFLGTCLTLGDTASIFANLPGQWTLTDGLGNPAGTTQGLALIPGLATLPIYLDPSAQWRVLLRYHLTTNPTTGDALVVYLGQSQNITIPLPDDSAEQTFTTDYVNWTPDSGQTNLFTLGIGREFAYRGDLDPLPVVDFACVESNGQNTVAPGAGGAIVTAECAQCLYAPKGGLVNLPDDIISLINWLWCGIKRLFTCYVASFLNGLWKGVINAISFLAFLRLWAGEIIKRVIIWAFTSAANFYFWAGGTARNLIQWVVNGIINLYNQLGIVAAVNWILGFIQGVINFLINVLPGLAVALWTIVVYWLSQIVSTLANIILIIPALVSGIVSGFNNTTTAIPLYAPVCTDTASFFYYPCLGGYILDNTVWDGPIFLGIFLVMGIIGFNTVLWSFRAIQEALSK